MSGMTPEKPEVHLVIFCVSVQFSESKWRFIENWLHMATRHTWGVPSTIRYCGNPNFENHISVWASMWFDCSYFMNNFGGSGSKLNISGNLGSELGQVLTDMEVNRKKSPKSSTESSDSPRESGNRRESKLFGKKSPKSPKSQNPLPSWLQKTVDAGTHIIIFSETKATDALVQYINERPVIMISTRFEV